MAETAADLKADGVLGKYAKIYSITHAPLERVLKNVSCSALVCLRHCMNPTVTVEPPPFAVHLVPGCLARWMRMGSRRRMSHASAPSSTNPTHRPSLPRCCCLLAALHLLDPHSVSHPASLCVITCTRGQEQGSDQRHSPAWGVILGSYQRNGRARTAVVAIGDTQWLPAPPHGTLTHPWRPADPRRTRQGGVSGQVPAGFQSALDAMEANIVAKMEALILEREERLIAAIQGGVAPAAAKAANPPPAAPVYTPPPQV